ncbi:MAG: DUF4433 domain-containing protein [bacterium]|nr:DUF4433 domain-containing protein [bacterium]
MVVPDQPKIYHIVHVDRLQSIVKDGCLWCDAEGMRRKLSGTCIGNSNIKQRRLKLPLDCHPGLRVGDCVPFYFSPRSVMLYLINKGNHSDLGYRGGQGDIVHLEADLRNTVNWAEQDAQGKRWAFTLSNAGSNYFEVRCDLSQLAEIDWTAVHAADWSKCMEKKQAEFLIEHSFTWGLVERIAVSSPRVKSKVLPLIQGSDHRPLVEVKPEWYY